jgi:outer membrane biosynthesis protein TonB
MLRSNYFDLISRNHRMIIYNRAYFPFFFLSILAVLFSLPDFAQSSADLPGVWRGYVQTDSRKIDYELVLSDSAGTIVGYSRILFNVKGEWQYAVKTLSVEKKEEDAYVMEEVYLVSHTLKELAPQKIKQINTLLLSREQMRWVLSGIFKAKGTMGLRGATGDIVLYKEVSVDSSALFSELKKLNKSDSLSFVKNPPKAPPKNDSIRTASVSVVSPPKQVSDTVIARVNTPKPPVPQPAPKPAVTKKNPPANPPKPVAVAPKPAPPDPPPSSPPKQSVSPVAAVQVTPAAPKPPPPKPVAIGSAAELSKRNVETIQTVFFKNDSLRFTLYDNGEVDGDTVSVVINGKVFMGKKGLSTSPTTETYYITAETGDSLQLIMYAESLGSIPPNTGLLIVMDGTTRHEIRFSADLTKSAAVVFRRKRP